MKSFFNHQKLFFSSFCLLSLFLIAAVCGSFIHFPQANEKHTNPVENHLSIASSEPNITNEEKPLFDTEIFKHQSSADHQFNEVKDHLSTLNSQHKHGHHQVIEEISIAKQNWQKQRFANFKNHTTTWKPLPKPDENIQLQFPVPNDKKNKQGNDFLSINIEHLLSPLVEFFLPKTAQAVPIITGQFGNIALDGELSDWTIQDRINFPLDLPPYLATGHELYGKYVSSPVPAYVIALKSSGAALGSNTTFWLNTDQDATTGHLVWDTYGGAEFFINLFSDSTPHLYDQNFQWVSGLEHAFSTDNKIIEIAIPATFIGITSSAQSINLLGDINDNEFLFPQDYPQGGQFTLAGTTPSLPPRTDFTKRVGIVYSESTKNHFFGEKTYSQLFMSLQHQAMMAGIQFDLLSENDLIDMNNLANLDALIFPFFSHVPDEKFNQIHDALFAAVYHYGIGIITADDWMTSLNSGQSLSGDVYRNMKQLLGIGRVSGQGPVNMDLLAESVNHMAMSGYQTNELITSYKGNWYSYYQAVPGQPIDTLAKQTVTGSHAGTYPAMIASTTGGRNIHFATIGYMADTNLVWQALQWVVFGDNTAVGLKMGRKKNIFVSRNDMDQSQFVDDIQVVHVPLLDLIKTWKDNYNFVGSYFINIGNDPANGAWTNWNVSAPLFTDYIQLDNEIGTHSWTHPHVTDNLTENEIEFEFNQSMNEIANNISPTWESMNIRGGAVPGAPESLKTATEIIQHVDYLSGGYSSTGAGYPNAIGFLTPESNKVYFSPNMSFDFTLIQFGVPVGNPPVPVPLTPEEAEQYWKAEFDSLMSHASQPIIHWPWHDYGPTTSADPISGDGYTEEMFTNTVAMAYNAGSEFVTSAEAVERINTFRNSAISVTHSAENSLTATINANQVGKFSLAVNTAPGEVIQNVGNWYAYHDNKVFLDQDGGTYTIQLGATADANTHISGLPMRSKLLSVSGDGNGLQFSFKGQGWVEIDLRNRFWRYKYSGVRSGKVLNSNKVAFLFKNSATHSITITSR